jgi:hypothetical protein
MINAAIEATLGDATMVRKWAVLASALGAAFFASPADANSAWHHHHYATSNRGYYPGYYIGYWAGSGHWARSRQLSRPGPSSGYKFGWVTYRGDPFAGQDFFDGHSCYYTYQHDYCVGRHWRGGFRW